MNAERPGVGRVGAMSDEDRIVQAIEMQDVSFAWPGRDGYGIEIDHFALDAGSSTLLLGPSGSGKSTFLSLLCGIGMPTRGMINILGTDITKLSGRQRDRFRAEHIGIIFQMFNLLPYGSVRDNVALPLSFAHKRRERVLTQGTIAAEVSKMLQALGLSDKQINGRSSALSVGQQQRVAIARALMGSPELIVADEPTSALDNDRSARFLELLMQQVSRANATLIVVSHDETLADQFDQVLHLNDIVTAKAAP